MNILGISCFFHDAAAALIQDGIVIAAAEEERFSRVKHDSGFPIHAIEFCLRTAGLRGEDLDWVVFYEKPFVKFDRILMSTLHGFPSSLRLFRESMVKWLAEKLWVKGLIRKRVGIPPGRILFSGHHLSHAASAFYCSPFREAAILTVDGVGEWATAAFGVGRDRNIELQGELRFPHSLGLLYSVFTAFLGFEVNEGEYKVMGMAPYGTPRYADEVWKLVRLGGDGAVALDMDYFSYHRSPDTAFTAKFEQLFGPPRDSKSHFFTQASGYPSYFGDRPPDYEELCRRNQHYADIAASIQHVTEEILITMVRALHSRTNLRRLCLAGGVALNSVANGRILRETPFEDIYVQPSAGDGGGAIGAALHVYHEVLGHPRKFVMDHAYWGPQYDATAVEAAVAARQDELDPSRYALDRVADERELCARTARQIADGKVVGSARRMKLDAPVWARPAFGLEINLEAIGQTAAKSKKYRDALRHPQVAFVIDDIASFSPWRVRGIEVRGEVEVLEAGGTELGPGFAPEMFRITARRIVSWGLGDGTSASARTVA